MALKAVFFDLDETLCNTNASRLERATLMVRRLREHDATLDEGSLIHRALGPNLEHGVPTGSRIIDELGLGETEAGREARGLWFFDGCTHLVKPNEGVVDLLNTLSRRYVLGVITNGLHAIQRRKFDALMCGEHFRAGLFVTSELAGAPKPDSAIFRFALQACDLQPWEAAHVGDNAQVDVRGAQGVGMRGIWYNRHHEVAPDHIAPDGILMHFDELPEMLRQFE
jgi:putative hydrolase of the HAD superfamily